MGGAAALRARTMEAKVTMAERSFNLVEPLAHKATAMRTTDTIGSAPARSGAVSHLSNRVGDVDRSMSPAGPGIRTSTTATRTTTTRTTSSAPEPSADRYAAADLSFTELVQAYFDCRRTKRNSNSALAFEANLERNLRRLYDELVEGTWAPGRSICFVVMHPKPREVWASGFRDRIVHHLLCNRVAPRFYAGFTADTCACIPGRGTLYGAKRLESQVRSITQNWSVSAHYLKLDLSNFFVSIRKDILREQLARRIHEPWWMDLAKTILFHDPRTDVEVRSSPELLALVPPHKRLVNAPAATGLPIGNLSSQFFANVLLDDLDQRVKHVLRIRHYVRYVDDFILLDQSPQRLNAALADIDAFLPSTLGVQLNPRKTILQPIERGIDFVGHVIKPWRRTTRPRTLRVAMQRIEAMPDGEVFEAGNSYMGLLRQASHSHKDRSHLANALMARGHCVKGDLTKIYRNT
jgi:RNA-directed DNA polymerase